MEVNSQWLVKEVNNRKYLKESRSWARGYDSRPEVKAQELHIILRLILSWQTLSNLGKVWMASEEVIRPASLRSYSNHPSSRRLQFRKLRISYRGLIRSFNIKEKALGKLPASPTRHHQNRSNSRLIMLISIFRKAATRQRCPELIPHSITNPIQTSALD